MKMLDKLKVGEKKSVTMTVTENDTALAMKSGNLKVLATPRLVGLIEEAASTLVENFLSADYTSVGTNLNVNHVAPTPIGSTVRADVELVEIDGRKLTFRVSAADDAKEIFNGSHERFIVNREKFLAKVYKASS